ncbi:vomeronasal type-1 receptor 4-like [Suncus etruscus]|uniref:vomeronasal type-1 receptor 4-like n=1 Tax=Suncus etruscus TaxID=109475 RepID=UPI00210FFD74|nr:vomeronasal type-1 receptor 4-like [Suncus etruscus]
MSVMSHLSQGNNCCHLSDDSAFIERTPFMIVTVGAIILSQTIIGVLGNFSLLSAHLLLSCTGARLRAIDLILMHLTIANSLIILSNGVPQTMAEFGIKQSFSDLGCHLLSYIHRVGRGVSMGNYCLLSVFQAIKISPRDSCCKHLKFKAPQYVTLSVSLSWILHMFGNLFFPLHILYVSNTWSLKDISKQNWGFCHVTYIDNVSVPVYITLIAFPEILCTVLIVWTSGSMILFLHRHKQRVQHIHQNHASSRISAERRATQRILVLVSSFLCFYSLSSLVRMWLALFPDKNRWLFNVGIIISLCFPIVSPFLVMKDDATVFRLSFVLIMNRISHNCNHN